MHQAIFSRSLKYQIKPLGKLLEYQYSTLGFDVNTLLAIGVHLRETNVNK